MRQVVALVMSFISLGGCWIVGNKSWKGWAINLANQGLWLIFIVMFQAWGLLPYTIGVIITYTRNMLRWRADPPDREVALRTP